MSTPEILSMGDSWVKYIIENRYIASYYGLDFEGLWIPSDNCIEAIKNNLPFYIKSHHKTFIVFALFSESWHYELLENSDDKQFVTPPQYKILMPNPNFEIIKFIKKFKEIVEICYDLNPKMKVVLFCPSRIDLYEHNLNLISEFPPFFKEIFNRNPKYRDSNMANLSLKVYNMQSSLLHDRFQWPNKSIFRGNLILCKDKKFNKTFKNFMKGKFYTIHKEVSPYIDGLNPHIDLIKSFWENFIQFNSQSLSQVLVYKEEKQVYSSSSIKEEDKSSLSNQVKEYDSKRINIILAGDNTVKGLNFGFKSIFNNISIYSLPYCNLNKVIKLVDEYLDEDTDVIFLTCLNWEFLYLLNYQHVKLPRVKEDVDITKIINHIKWQTELWQDKYKKLDILWGLPYPINFYKFYEKRLGEAGIPLKDCKAPLLHAHLAGKQFYASILNFLNMWNTLIPHIKLIDLRECLFLEERDLEETFNDINLQLRYPDHCLSDNGFDPSPILSNRFQTAFWHKIYESKARNYEKRSISQLHYDNQPAFTHQPPLIPNQNIPYQGAHQPRPALRQGQNMPYQGAYQPRPALIPGQNMPYQGEHKHSPILRPDQNKPFRRVHQPDHYNPPHPSSNISPHLPDVEQNLNQQKSGKGDGDLVISGDLLSSLKNALIFFNKEKEASNLSIEENSPDGNILQERPNLNNEEKYDDHKSIKDSTLEILEIGELSYTCDLNKFFQNKLWKDLFLKGSLRVAKDSLLTAIKCLLSTGFEEGVNIIMITTSESFIDSMENYLNPLVKIGQIGINDYIPKREGAPIIFIDLPTNLRMRISRSRYRDLSTLRALIVTGDNLISSFNSPEAIELSYLIKLIYNRVSPESLNKVVVSEKGDNEFKNIAGEILDTKFDLKQENTQLGLFELLQQELTIPAKPRKSPTEYKDSGNKSRRNRWDTRSGSSDVKKSISKSPASIPPLEHVGTPKKNVHSKNGEHGSSKESVGIDEQPEEFQQILDRLGPEAEKEYLEVGQKILIEHEKQYINFIDVPFFHPDYRKKHDKFAEVYQKKHGVNYKISNMENDWMKFWRNYMNNIKYMEWKSKQSKLQNKILNKYGGDKTSDEDVQLVKVISKEQHISTPSHEKVVDIKQEDSPTFNNKELSKNAPIEIVKDKLKDDKIVETVPVQSNDLGIDSNKKDDKDLIKEKEKDRYGSKVDNKPSVKEIVYDDSDVLNMFSHDEEKEKSIKYWEKFKGEIKTKTSPKTSPVSREKFKSEIKKTPTKTSPVSREKFKSEIKTKTSTKTSPVSREKFKSEIKTKSSTKTSPESREKFKSEIKIKTSTESREKFKSEIKTKSSTKTSPASREKFKSEIKTKIPTKTFPVSWEKFTSEIETKTHTKTSPVSWEKFKSEIETKTPTKIFPVSWEKFKSEIETKTPTKTSPVAWEKFKSEIKIKTPTKTSSEFSFNIADTEADLDQFMSTISAARQKNVKDLPIVRKHSEYSGTLKSSVFKSLESDKYQAHTTLESKNQSILSGMRKRERYDDDQDRFNDKRFKNINEDNEKLELSALEKSLSHLDSICQHMGMMGPAVKVIISQAKMSLPNLEEAYKVLRDEDSIALIKLGIKKMNSIGFEASAIKNIEDLLAKSMKSSSQNVPQQHGHLKQPPSTFKDDIDVISLAKATYGKDIVYTYKFIRDAYLYRGLKEPSKQEIEEIFRVVSEIHFKMSIKS